MFTSKYVMYNTWCHCTVNSGLLDNTGGPFVCNFLHAEQMLLIFRFLSLRFHFRFGIYVPVYALCTWCRLPSGTNSPTM